MLNKQGSTLLLTLIFMVGLMGFASAYISLIVYDTKNVGGQENNVQALYLSEAGLNKAIYYLLNTAPDSSTDGSWRTTAYPAAAGAGTTDPQQESLGNGAYTLWVETSGSNVQITARGTINSIERVIRQMVTLTSDDWADAFSYAIFSNQTSDELELKDDVTINGDIYYNYTGGSVDVDSNATVSASYKVYANSVTGSGTYTQAAGEASPVPAMPTLTTTTYDSAITTAQSVGRSDLTLDNTDNLNLSGTAYYDNFKVKGDATVTGSGTIVCTHDCKVEDNGNIGANITIIAVNKIEIKDDAVVQQGGVLYSQNEIKLKNDAVVTASLIVPGSSDKIKMENDATLTGIIYGGTVELKGDATINGAVVGDSYKNDEVKDNVTINYNSSYLPSTIPTGIQAGSTLISSVAGTWDEI